MKKEVFDKYFKPITEYKKSCDKIEDIYAVIDGIEYVPNCKLVFIVDGKTFEIVNFGVGLVSEDYKKEFWVSFTRSLKKIIKQEEKKKKALRI